MKARRNREPGTAVAEQPAVGENMAEELTRGQLAVDIPPEVILGPVELVQVELIQPHPRNARHGDIGALTELIKKNGFYGHCIVQRSSGNILVGNHRYKAATAIGMRAVPVQWLDVDDEHALRILLSDNRSSDLASYNDALLVELLKSQQLEVGTLDGTGFDGDALDELMHDLENAAAAAGASNGTANGNDGAAPVIQYNIIFDTEVQQRKWFEFLNSLRKVYPEGETIAERIIRYVEERPAG